MTLDFYISDHLTYAKSVGQKWRQSQLVQGHLSGSLSGATFATGNNRLHSVTIIDRAFTYSFSLC